jgi:simple sugar transport system ATP-binding protein
MSSQPHASERDPRENTSREPGIALRTVDVTKRFGDFVANYEVSMDVAQGSIHALVGENGAGKTTLMRMVYGLYTPDAGQVEIHGENVALRSPRDALAMGVAMVHQTSLLVDSLTVADNVRLSLSRRAVRHRGDVAEALASLSETHSLGLDPRLEVRELSVGMRQRAEILAALYHQASVLILDEPTTVLTPAEAQRLFDILRTLRSHGAAVILVTHKLREVLSVSDTVTVLRAGEVVVNGPTQRYDEHDLVKMMVGRSVPMEIGANNEDSRQRSEQAVLTVEEVVVTDKFGVRRLDGVNVTVRPGEIVAVTGVEGNGQRELVETVTGTRRPSSGSVVLGGTKVARMSIGRRRRLGLGYIPESRATEGVSAGMSVEDNLVLGGHAKPPYARLGFRRMRAVKRFAQDQVADYAIATRGPGEPVGRLSGGNAQKVVVAREVERKLAVLVAVQPTQGVDVAAVHAIRSVLADLRARGVGVLLVTSDLREACDLGDRAVVLYNGRVAGELQRGELTEESIGALAMGVTV